MYQLFVTIVDNSLLYTVFGALGTILAAFLRTVSAAAIQLTEGRVSITAINFYR